MDSYEIPSTKCSLAEILDHQSCAVCQSIRRSYGDLKYMGTCRSDLAAQIKHGTEESQCTVYSTACETLGKQKQQMHSQEHQVGSTPNGVEEKEESNVRRHFKRENHGVYCPEHSFLGSSLYYGGPDELYDILKGRKEGQNGNKMEVKQLEEAMDPFNLSCTTRGNWWEGSLYY